MPAAPSNQLAVSVVVAVYNPGPHIDACIDSLLSQSMPSDRYEVIFVDDGSTDDTPARLDQLALEHVNVRVIHQPNSGWSGKPRNVGIDAAGGEYVFFCDHDDRLAPKALARMVAMARRTGADVLIPKMVGHRRRVPRTIFRRNIDAAVLGVDEVMASLTPHKLFRRKFLNAHGLRFPEGRRRLEDHVFVVEAYIRATVISVLADYPCYHHYRRDDRGNAAYEKWDAKYYYGFVAEVIDVIDRLTDPGQLREALLYRPYRVEMLGRLFGERINRWDAESRVEIFNTVRELALTRFPSGFHERFHIAPRAHAAALVADRLDRLSDVAERVAAASLHPEISDFIWSNGRLTFKVAAELRHEDGSPLRMIPDHDGWRIDAGLIPIDLQAERYDTAEVTRAEVDVLAQHRTEEVRWYVPTSLTPELIEIPGDPDRACRLVVRGTGDLDPNNLAGGRPLTNGQWDLHIHAEILGILRMAPARVEAVEAEPALLVAPNGQTKQVTPRMGAKGRVWLRVQPPEPPS